MYNGDEINIPGRKLNADETGSERSVTKGPVTMMWLLEQEFSCPVTGIVGNGKQ